MGDALDSKHGAMRVALVMAQLGDGGTEEQARLLAIGCADRGVHIDVFVLGGARETTESGFGPVHLQYLDDDRGRRSTVRLLRSAARLRRALKEGRYDIVHAVLARAHVVVPAVRPRGTKVVGWRRNLGDHLGSAGAARGLRVLAERAAARRTDALVANSAEVAAFWEHTLRLRPGTIEVIPNGLEPWRFEPAEPVRRFPEPLLVSVGGLRAVKGHRHLLDAAARLRPDHPVRVAIVGDGPLAGELRRRAAELSVPLELPGHLADPRPWLAAAAVYVHPSLSEGSSNAILEAMAAGCAVVATAVGDTAVLVGDGGAVVAPGDPAALAAGIRSLLDAPQSATTLAARGRSRAAEQFSAARMVESHVGVYRRLAGSRSD